MKFIRASLAVTIAFLFSISFSGTYAEAGTIPERIPALDSLASDISVIGYVPSGGKLPVLAAVNQWYGLLSGVYLLPGDDPELDAILSDTSGEYKYYGIASWSSGGDMVLVLAPPSCCLPLDIYPEVTTGSEVNFILNGYTALKYPEAAIRTPGMEVIDLTPDSCNRCAFSAGERGIYWIEIMEQTASGPSIVLLFPVISGVSFIDVLNGDLDSETSEAGCPEDVLEELNILREKAGISPLLRNSMLDSIASIRASALAFSGTSVHFGSDNNGLPDILPAGIEAYGENISRGKGYQEAWSMILISPFHLRTCLSPAFVYTGIAGAVDSSPYEWQLVMIQIFTSRDDGLW